MPYWSSSRVGAVPQGQPTKQKKRNEKSNRKKGITMEDLKKQTALRLAQEQKQQGRFVPRGVSTNTPNGSVSAFGVVDNGNTTAGPPLTQAGVQVEGLAFHVMGGTSAPTGSYSPIRDDPVPRSNIDLYPAPNPAFSHKVVKEQIGERGRSMTPTGSSSSRDSSSQRRKTMLPHGLTVSELKEMTKARLEAEASEHRDIPITLPDPRTTMASPVGPQDLYREPLVRNTAPSPSFNVPGQNPRSPHGREGWVNESRLDTWDAASTGTAPSEFGSPEVFYSSIGASSSFNDDPGAYPFNRSRSYSANNTRFGQGEDIGAPHEVNYFESPQGYIPNRRRAATLSPRAGLSHLHEDRPFLHGQNIPSIPAFAPHSNQRHLPVRAQSPFLSESFHNFVGNSFDHETNRARTASAVSLPAISSTAREFGSSQYGLFRDEAPSPVVTGLSDVFRDSPNRGLSSNPPGIIGGSELHVSTFSGLGSVDSFSDTRARTHTWGEPSMDFFGPKLIGSSDDVGLSDDLASILKLSGAEEKPDGASLFSPPGL